MELLKKIQVQAALAVMAILVFGTCGYYFLEDGWSVMDALFMTVITVSTIGYGEIHPLSATGRVFTIALVFVGLGTTAVFATHLAQFIIEGELKGLFGRKKMLDRIKKLSKHYLVCGFGNIGSTICLKLYEMNIPFVVIENDPESATAAQRRGYPVITGNASKDEILLSAGIKRASGMVLCINDDSANIFIALAARELNPGLHIISRGSDPEIESRMIRAGADVVVYPLRLGGEQIAAQIAGHSGITPREKSERTESGLMGFHLRTFRNLAEKEITIGEIAAKKHVVSIPALITEFGDTIENPPDGMNVGSKDTVLMLIRKPSAGQEEETEVSPESGLPPNLHLGIRQIDEDHLGLFHHIGKFNEALKTGRRDEALLKIFDKLLDYTAKHFQREENLMNRHNYPDRENHFQEHKKLSMAVLDLNKDKMSLYSGMIGEFLNNWLIEHILKSDMELAAFLLEKGER